MERSPSSSTAATNGSVIGASGLMQQQPRFQDGVGGTEPSHCQSKEVSETKGLAAELCRHFYTLGWVSGTGGSISIKVHDDSLPKPQQLLVMSPSGVEKERMVPDDMYVLSSDGLILSTPPLKPYPHQHHKCTDCAPVFMKITHMEMIKGIKGHGYHDELVLPIIENTAHEGELTEYLSEAIRAYPKATAILVRNHGAYIWGDSWINAKTQAECYHYLFDAAIKLHQLGFDWSTPRHSPLRVHGVGGCGMNFSKGLKTGSFSLDYMIEPSHRRMLLNIEGTTTHRSFVSNILLNVGKHLAATYDTEETQDAINLMRSQIRIQFGLVGRDAWQDTFAVKQ